MHISTLQYAKYCEFHGDAIAQLLFTARVLESALAKVFSERWTS